MKTSCGTILVVDDDPDVQEVLKDRLESLGYEVLTASNGQSSLDLLKTRSPQMMLLDITLPDINGIELLKEIRRRGNDFPVVMITAHGTIEKAVLAMKEGAQDFIPKPFDADHITMVVRRALEQENLRREVQIFAEEVGKRYRLIAGKSAAMRDSIETARKAAASNATVLLLGESGTGKELFARAIHNWSERKNEPFVAINCVGLSRDLLESELFGHEKGAFTGAHQLKKGKLELAQGGTVFFDEIGDVTAELQTKLLRFLQEREFERVGGAQVIRVDLRIIAATNQDLHNTIKEGRFRQDLYHRLNVVQITLPPLRERKEDILPIADHFMRRFSVEAKKNFTEITQEAQEKLFAYDWPGNVRELANVMERAIVLGTGPKLTFQDLPPRILAHQSRSQPDGLSYREAVDAYRREFISRALAQTQGNRLAAAKTLGLHEKSLIRLLRALRIH
jgi:two-component system, NtrC family, response regulator AtoC